jgi:hypothetical protein
MASHKHHFLPLEKPAGHIRKAHPRVPTFIMPETATPNLIQMTRLLDGELSAAEEAPLRRLIANDLKLAEQYRHLTRVLQQPLSPAELLQHADQVDPLTVTDFVECRMTESAQTQFERHCWNSDSLLREVVSTWRAGHEAAAIASEVVSENRVRSVVTSLLGESGAEQPPVITKPEEQEAFRPDLPPEPETATSQSTEQPELPQIVVANEPEMPPQRPRRAKGLVVTTTGVAVALVLLALQSLWKPDGQEARRDDRDRKVNPDPGDSPPIMVQDGPGTNGGSPDKSPVIPDSPDPEEGPGKDPIVRKDPGPDPMPDKPVPDPGTRIPAAVELVEWSDIRGVVGVRDSAAIAWSGILNTKVADLWKSNARTQLLTLAQSAASGKAVNGVRLMAAADSLVEISSGPSRGARTAPTDDDLIPACEVQFGRFAFVGLSEGQHVRVLVNGQALEIQATRDDTTIAVERESQETILAAYRGEVRVDGRKLTRRRFGRVDSTGSLNVFRPKQVNEWPRAQPDSRSLPGELCDAFNQSPNLIQQAARVRQSSDPVTGFVATQVALQCSASGADPLPLNLARQIAGSGNEAHRHTLVQWLVTRFRQNPSVGEADLKLLFRLQQIDRQMATRMTGWFQAAAEGRRPTVMQLTELTNGLRDPAPLFTKQCAKFFLQKILGDPLTEYNPRAAAGRTALSSVTRKVRAWQQANLK